MAPPTAENPDGYHRLISGGVELGETHRDEIIREVRIVPVVWRSLAGEQSLSLFPAAVAPWTDRLAELSPRPN